MNEQFEANIRLWFRIGWVITGGWPTFLIKQKKKIKTNILEVGEMSENGWGKFFLTNLNVVTLIKKRRKVTYSKYGIFCKHLFQNRTKKNSYCSLNVSWRKKCQKLIGMKKKMKIYKICAFTQFYCFWVRVKMNYIPCGGLNWWTIDELIV